MEQDTARLADQLWADVTADLGTNGLDRIRGLLDTWAGRREIVTAGPLQKARYNLWMPDLPTSAWLDPSTFAFSELLESKYELVKAELLQAVESGVKFKYFGKPEGTPLRPKRPEGWKDFPLLFHLERYLDNCKRCPETAKITDFIVDYCKAVSQVNFIALDPGTHLAAHTDVFNFMVSYHLGIIVPEDCSIRVGSETRGWTEGKGIAFDNSFEHEAWNRSDRRRIILAVHTTHPDLTERERTALPRVLKTLYPMVSEMRDKGQVGTSPASHG